MNDTDPKLAMLFAAAVELDSPEQRATYLARECPDPQERAEVESLLAAHEQPDTLFTRRTSLVEASATERIGTMIGRYKLLEAIGEGGFGSVWLAEQKEPVRRKVALKVIKLGMDTRQVVARFEAERQALALMDHPNIAKVLDAGATETGRPYFVMELVRGVPITKFCDENRLATRDRLDLFIKVCHAVQHAHQKGIIHRDLKPSNVLVTLHDGVPVPKVIDFGIAKATQQELTDKTIHTLFQQFIGTPAYVSPEQAEMSGLDIDTRSDIYSLGVLLYELLTGATPLNARTLVQSGLDEMRRIIREEEPKRPSTHLSTLGMAEATTLAEQRREKLPALLQLVRGDLDWIVMKCLEKDRTRRYETVNGLAADLKRHLHNEPVMARPPSKLYEFQKTVRRHKLSFAAAGAVMVALAAGVAVSAWQLVRARNAETKAEESNYLNRMALAHWNLTHEPPNILEAERLLDACKPQLRGWEWDYLKHQWWFEPYVLRDPGQRLNSLAFSPDDRYLAAAGTDGKVTVWEVATRQAIQSLTAHTNGFAFCVAFDPGDARRLVSAGDKQVKLWDWTRSKVLHSWPIQYGFEWGMSYAVAFSPDGQRVAACAGSGSVMVWSAITGEEVCRVTHRGEAAESPVMPVTSLAFSRDGQRLASGGVDGIVCVSDARSGHRIKTLGHPTNPIAGVAFTKDGRRLTAASFDYWVRVFDVESGAMLWRWRAHSGSILSLALSPDNQRLATGSEDRTLKLWALDWAEKTSREVLTFRDFTKAVQCASFSQDGRQTTANGCSR